MYIPEFLLKLAQMAPQHQAWLDTLPMSVRQAEKKWELTLGVPYEVNASCSYVVPCTVRGEQEAVLKIGLPHEEARHEIDGLRILAGNPTVRLLDFDRQLNALLLEKCEPGTPLKNRPEEQQDEVIAELLPLIWQAKDLSIFRPLTTKFALDEAEGLAHFPDPALAREGFRLKQQLSHSSEQQVLLATDLHAGNVLEATRRPWLIIDPKPYLGDRAYDLTQHLFNCKPRLKTQARETIERVAALARINKVRLRDWTFSRLASENDGKDQSLAVQIRNISF